ncbi:hypothetical protein Bpfe_022830, partial [Biomphalaria pfeifferi]
SIGRQHIVAPRVSRKPMSSNRSPSSTRNPILKREKRYPAPESNVLRDQNTLDKPLGPDNGSRVVIVISARPRILRCPSNCAC